nr:MAG TPA: hypothetical protein [Caudoviricetes sp.]
MDKILFIKLRYQDEKVLFLQDYCYTLEEISSIIS